MKKTEKVSVQIRNMLFSLVFTFVLLSSASGVQAQGVSFQQVAFEGDAVADGGEFSSFQNAVINNDTTVAFVGFTTGQVATCSNKTVNLWKSVAGVIQSPVCTDALSNFGRDTILNANGDLAFTQFSGTYSESGGLHQVVSRSIPVPGFPDEKFDILNWPVMNDSGDINFYGSTDITNTQGLWSETGGAGTLASLVLDGDPAAGLPDKVFTRQVRLRWLVIPPTLTKEGYGQKDGMRKSSSSYYTMCF